MTEILKDYMKEDALLFDTLSKEICKKDTNSTINYELLLEKCKEFENRVVLFNIMPTYYVMKTILYFKINDYVNANKYINASLKYLIYIAKKASNLSLEEEKNFNTYKENVLDQFKILTTEKPEYINPKRIELPDTVKFITCDDNEVIEKEQNIRLLMRKHAIDRKTALNNSTN